MTTLQSSSKIGTQLNPAREKLWSKLTTLEETLKAIDPKSLTGRQLRSLEICQDYLRAANQFLADQPRFRFWRSRRPHLVWELLHRVDEELLLLYDEDELYSRALEVKNYFELNITPEQVRQEWLGPQGQFPRILGEIQQRKNLRDNRHLLRRALKLVNDQVDRSFWQLSVNILISVASGVILGCLLIWAWAGNAAARLQALPEGLSQQNFATLLVLGLMGAYVANLLTREDFLFIRGGPFWRYFFHHLGAKPALSAFAAVFSYLVERTKLLFSFSSGSPAGQAAATQLLTLNVSPENLGYVYALLGLVSGFAAEKVLRAMIDRVLKKLEQQAEKSKETQTAAP